MDPCRWLLVVGVVVPSATALKPLKFMHITKTGGTAIEEFGRLHNHSWGRFHTQTEKAYGLWHELPERKNKTVLHAYDWFTVVRNPFDRMISEYYCHYGGRGRKPNATAAEFNELLRQRIAAHAHDPYNGHYTIQALYMRILSPTTTLRLVFYEHLHEISSIFRDYGLPPFPVSRASSRRGSFHVQDMDPETVALIQTTYRSDFDAFGYSPNPRAATLWKPHPQKGIPV